ncbi:hypothetical protein [Streptomyces halstedii]
MTCEAWVLLALIALGLLDLAAIAVGWVADHHLTTARHRRKDS